MNKFIQYSIFLLFLYPCGVYAGGGSEQKYDLVYADCNVKKVYKYEEDEGLYQVIVVNYKGCDIPIQTSPLSKKYESGETVKIARVAFKMSISGEEKTFINFIVADSYDAENMEIFIQGTEF